MAVGPPFAEHAAQAGRLRVSDLGARRRAHDEVSAARVPAGGVVERAEHPGVIGMADGPARAEHPDQREIGRAHV